MAVKPGSPPAKSPAFNETAIAIAVSLLIGAVLATVLTGNPMRATVLAYTDYSHTPAAGAPKASDTNAPLTQEQVNAKVDKAEGVNQPAPVESLQERVPQSAPPAPGPVKQ